SAFKTPERLLSTGAGNGPHGAIFGRRGAGAPRRKSWAVLVWPRTAISLSVLWLAGRSSAPLEPLAPSRSTLIRAYGAVNNMLWLSTDFKQFLGVSPGLFPYSNHKILGPRPLAAATVLR